MLRLLSLLSLEKLWDGMWIDLLSDVLFEVRTNGVFMRKNEKFTFRQALINVTIACSIVIGLSLSKGFDFYKKIESVLVIAVVLIVAAIVLISKWRSEKSETTKRNKKSS